MPVADRRMAILTSAARLFASKGVAATTVRDIADAVGILSGSLYHHFASKEEILEAVIGEYTDSVLARYEAVTETGDPIERIRSLIRASIEVAVTSRDANEIYQANAPALRSRGSQRLIGATARTHEIWAAAIRDGIAAGQIRSDIDPEVLYRFMRDAIWTTPRWYRDGGRLTVDGVVHDITEVFVAGMVRPEAGRR